MSNVSSLKVTDEIAAKGATHPRVTLDDIEGSVKAQYFFTGKEAVEAVGAPAAPGLELLTVCILVMQNGFTVIGKSAPASPENFDPEKGRTFAREDAVRQLWPLMGYALREKLAA